MTRRTWLRTATLAPLALASPLPGAGKTLLTIGAHMDDNEWCAGGLICKALRDGLKVVMVQAVSDWSNWPQSQGREQHVRQGVLRIARDLGAEKVLLGYKYHHVPLDMDVKMRLVKIVERVQPDIAVVMSEADYWTDHANIARAGKDALMFIHGYLGRAFKGPSVILAGTAGFNQTWDFKPDTFVDVTDVIGRVCQTITALDNLLTDEPEYVATVTLPGLAEPQQLTSGAERVLAARSIFGEMAGVRYAEAFRTIRRTARDLW